MSNSKYIITLAFIGFLFVAVVVLLRSESPTTDNTQDSTNGTSTENNSEVVNEPPTRQNVQVQDQNEPEVESCIITVNGVQYDVQPFRDIHEGGDIFQCGSDMTDEFEDEHGFKGDEFEELQKYQIQ